MSATDTFVRASIILSNLLSSGVYMTEQEINTHAASLQNMAIAIVELRRAERQREQSPTYTQPLGVAHRQVAELRPRPTVVERVNALRSLTRPPTIKTISRANFEANCENMCSICHETHKKGDSMTTPCNHEFGKECWENWLANTNSNRKCPNCREVCYRITTFKTRTRRAVIEEEPLTERDEHAMLDI